MKNFSDKRLFDDLEWENGVRVIYMDSMCKGVNLASFSSVVYKK